MTTRRLWIWVWLLLLGGLVAGWLWQYGHRMAPQIVSMPNGIPYQFVQATYGTNHVMASGPVHVVRKLPEPLRSWARNLMGNRFGLDSHSTAHPSLCVWMQPLGTNPVSTTRFFSVQAMLWDEGGIKSGDQEYVSLWTGGTGPRWVRLDFPALPRRSKRLECHFYEHQRDGDVRELGHFSFPNPVYDLYPQWEPEPLPAVKMAGDLQVRLNRFSTGHGNRAQTVSQKGGPPMTRFRPARPGEEERAAFQLEFESPRGTNETWTLHGASLSDATGNQVRATGRTESGHGNFAIAPVLWPDEAAWRLTLELKRKAGFAPQELVTFTNVPVPGLGETNTPAMTNRVGEIRFALTQFSHRPEITGGSWSSSDATLVRIDHTEIPDGYAFDVVDAVATNNSPLEIISRGWSDTYYEVNFKSIPSNATSVTVTYAYQKTRQVEFLVNPVRVQPEE